MSSSSLLREIETIKAEIRAVALGLPVQVEKGSGPLTNYLSLEEETLRSLLNVVEPNWRSDPRFAATGAALDYLAELRPAAKVVAATLQTTMSSTNEK